MYLISAPDSNKWVAKLCLSVWGVTFFLIPTFFEADFMICWIVLLLYFFSLWETKIGPSFFVSYILNTSISFLWRKITLSLSPFAVFRWIISLSKSISDQLRFLASSNRRPA